MSDDRKRAIALGAADAKTLLRRHLPYIASIIAPAQLAQVQKVLDAEVVNPEIAKQANEVYRRSVIAQSGSVVMRDERMVNRAYRIQATRITVSESDQHIRLDYRRLLTADALRPTTDNPDEADYLSRVHNTLESKGIWLRFDNQLVRDPEDPSRWIVDPRTFIAWLSVGYDGDAIPHQRRTARSGGIAGHPAVRRGLLRCRAPGPDPEIARPADRDVERGDGPPRSQSTPG